VFVYWAGGGWAKAVLGDRGVQRFKDKFLIEVKATGGVRGSSVRGSRRKYRPHQAKVVNESLSVPAS